MVTRILYVKQCSSRHVNNAIGGGSGGWAVNICVNAVASVIYYQRYLCHDHFVKTPPKCPTNRLYWFNYWYYITAFQCKETITSPFYPSNLYRFWQNTKLNVSLKSKSLQLFALLIVWHSMAFNMPQITISHVFRKLMGGLQQYEDRWCIKQSFILKKWKSNF